MNDLGRKICASLMLASLLFTGCSAGQSAQAGQDLPVSPSDAVSLPEASQVFQDMETRDVVEETDAYTAYELSFMRDEMNIVGQLYLPGNGKETFPLVIFAHGFGSSYQYTASTAKILAEGGYACYVFDFCGGSASSESDGNMLDMSVMTEKQDLEAVLDGIREYPFINRDQIFLMGESQGGMVSALFAADRQEDVRGLILYYPAFVIPDDARERYQGEDAVPETSQIMGMPVGRRYFTDVLEMDVFQEIKPFEKNVLLIHGTQDHIVPISYSKQAAEIYKNAQLIEIPGAGHGFYGAQLQEAGNVVLQYLTQQTQAETTAQGEMEMKLQITVNGRTFDAVLYDNETAEAWKQQLPLTLNMSELNGNEKYYYLSDKLPTASKNPGQIHSGDIKLFGSDCLVLFYEDFSSGYSYTDIGYLENPEGLQEALGNGSVQVTFEMVQK